MHTNENNHREEFKVHKIDSASVKQDEPVKMHAGCFMKKKTETAAVTFIRQ